MYYYEMLKYPTEAFFFSSLLCSFAGEAAAAPSSGINEMNNNYGVCKSQSAEEKQIMYMYTAK